MFRFDHQEIYQTEESKWVINQAPTVFGENFRSPKQVKRREEAQSEKKRVIFLDRDGPCLFEPQTDGQIDSYERWELTQDLIVYLRQILDNLDYELVMVSNQNAVGSKLFPSRNFWVAHGHLLEVLASQGIIFDEIFVDKSAPEDNQPTRKPDTQMLTKFLESNTYDLAHSVVIGDRDSDMKLAKNLGSQGLHFNSEPSEISNFEAQTWEQVWQILQELETMGSMKK
jgi:imidazoleglycerol-phosphate dehydratase/histidinol-phosphatase